MLRVDLSAGTTSTIHTAGYVPQFVGGLGIAAKIAWDELEPGIGPFDPENLLFIMVGPLTGTLASGAGRVIVAGIAPQQRPSVFSRSGMGGYWGAELKYAGYDGVVVEGKAEKPVYLWIHDDQVDLLDAGDLWGSGTYATTVTLRNRHGSSTRVISCGPAGENLSRIACILTETGNAAGQGGYGGVMGSKNLKAIAVRGTQGVRVAQRDRFLDLCLSASREGQRPPRASQGQGEVRGPEHEMARRKKKCGYCMSDCAFWLFMNVPGAATSGTYNAARHCYGFRTPPRARVEAAALASDYGLNGWEISFGIIPWLQMCKQHGLIDKVNGIEIPVPDKEIEYYRDTAPYSGAFAAELLHKIATREDELGDALADGACYAAERLFGGRGEPLLDHIYPRHAGQTSHWNGHWGTGGNIYFPFWLVPILQWCVDTRDPASDCTHGYTAHMLSHLPEHGPNRGPIPLETARAVCAKIYGDPNVCDPSYAYDRPETKALPAIFHHDRGMAIECLILCDKEHTRVFSLESDDMAADTALPSKLFSACTGYETSEGELSLAGERILNLLRGIDIRNHNRSRVIDEATAESLTHPAFMDGVVLDLDRFADMLDTYYNLRGWNPANGWPTRAKLEELGLGGVADALDVAGRIG